MKRIILASKSPRRIELLGRLVEQFDIQESRIEEKSSQADPYRLACELAERKAADVSSRNPDALVIGADTVVALGGQLLGKPEDEAQAREMIALLAGKNHMVYTGVSVVAQNGCKTICCQTRVTFTEMSSDEIDAYIAAGDWTDKAGAYGIQGAASKYISGICGDYYNVVGLPLNALYKLLKEF